MTELSETKVRSISITIQLSVARLAMSSSTYIILFMNNLNLNPLVFILITSSIAAICAVVLPDTHGWQIKN